MTQSLITGLYLSVISEKDAAWPLFESVLVELIMIVWIRHFKLVKQATLSRLG